MIPVVALGLTATVVAFGAALLVMTFKFVDAQKDLKYAERRCDMLTLQVTGLGDAVDDKQEHIGRLESLLASVKRQRDELAASAIAALPHSSVRDLVNGDDPDSLLPFPGAAHRDPDTGIDKAVSVPGSAAAAEPG